MGACGPMHSLLLLSTARANMRAVITLGIAFDIIEYGHGIYYARFIKTKNQRAYTCCCCCVPGDTGAEVDGSCVYNLFLISKVHVC